MNTDKTLIKDVYILRGDGEILTAKEPRHVVLSPDSVIAKVFENPCGPGNH